ncbi:MAG: hypothetical protein IKG32_05010 [Clostridia bacterium]|nr:hypothetical protein [Clostridia bacterium]
MAVRQRGAAGYYNYFAVLTNMAPDEEDYIESLILFLGKKKDQKELYLGSIACVILPVMLDKLLFFAPLFSLHRREKSGKRKN